MELKAEAYSWALQTKRLFVFILDSCGLFSGEKPRALFTHQKFNMHLRSDRLPQHNTASRKHTEIQRERDQVLWLEHQYTSIFFTKQTAARCLKYCMLEIQENSKLVKFCTWISSLWHILNLLSLYGCWLCSEKAAFITICTDSLGRASFAFQ